MIYIKRDESLIPERVLKVAERAQIEIEGLSFDERVSFIKKKSHIWRAFSRYLRAMSHNKCWYSEALEVQSFMHVDHFRPKLEAKRTEEVVDDEGYHWLAFDWDNYRLAAQRSNQETKDETTEELLGKGSWFPLVEDTSKACWEDRCVDQEEPMLLDPVVKTDVEFFDFTDDGQVIPKRHLVGIKRLRVEYSIKYYGLNLPKLGEERQRVIREVGKIYDAIMKMADELNELSDKAIGESIEIQTEVLKEKTRADSPYSAAVRSGLLKKALGQSFIDQTMDAT